MSESRQFIIFLLCFMAAICSFYSSIDSERAVRHIDAIAAKIEKVN